MARRKKPNGTAKPRPIALLPPHVPLPTEGRGADPNPPPRHAPACDGFHALSKGPCNAALREAVQRASAALGKARTYACVRCKKEWPLYALACPCGSVEWAEGPTPS